MENTLVQDSEIDFRLRHWESSQWANHVLPLLVGDYLIVKFILQKPLFLDRKSNSKTVVFYGLKSTLARCEKWSILVGFKS